MNSTSRDPPRFRLATPGRFCYLRKVHDVFLCHSSADKSGIVLPIYQALLNAGLSCWLDEAELRWGESLSAKIEDGLRKSQFVLVVLSPAFEGRAWPERELRAALQLEVNDSASRVLPLLVGSDAERASLLRSYPLLADKRYVTWSGRADVVVDSLRPLIAPSGRPVAASPAVASAPEEFVAPYGPTIRLRRTPRDLDQFARATFQTVCSYFEAGISALELEHASFESDFERVTSREMAATIYRDGDVATVCQIFLDALGMKNTIGVHWGVRPFGSNSVNGWLSIVDAGVSVGWSAESAALDRSQSRESLNENGVAEQLWRRFVAPLEN